MNKYIRLGTCANGAFTSIHTAHAYLEFPTHWHRFMLPFLAVCSLPAAGLFAGTDTATNTPDKTVQEQVLDQMTPLDLLNVGGELRWRLDFHHQALQWRGCRHAGVLR